MNKSELVEAIAHGAGITKISASKIVEVFTNTIMHALQKGEQVVIPGFGSFVTSVRSARTGRNPQTGQTIQIKASRIAKFKAGKKLKDAVSEK